MGPFPHTYSGTSPKWGAARASAAKILQYSRLIFWILQPCGYRKPNGISKEAPSSLAAWLKVGSYLLRDFQEDANPEGRG